MALVSSSARSGCSLGRVLFSVLVLGQLMSIGVVNGLAVLERGQSWQLDKQFLKDIRDLFGNWTPNQVPGSFSPPPVLDRSNTNGPSFPGSDEWSEWSNCIGGSQTRSRVPSYGQSCGSSLCVESRLCQSTPAASPAWGSWGPWSACAPDTQSGRYLRIRSRQCLSQSSYITVSTQACQGTQYDTQDCSPNSEVALTSWTSWTGCDSIGRKYRTRSCTGLGCRNLETTQVRVCQRTGIWSQWGSWSSCSNNSQRRQRRCNQAPCYGPYTQVSQCTGVSETPQTQSRLWSSWSPWSACEGGLQSRSRSCSSWSCPGFSREAQACGQFGQDISGWGAWSQWSVCNNGNQFRTRSCEGYAGCAGSSYETQQCTNSGSSTIDTTWGSWSPCIGQTQFRRRECADRFTPCPHSVYQTRNCVRSRVLASSDQWTSSTYRPWNSGSQSYGWGEWGPWDLHCQYGKRWRYRSCAVDPNRLGLCVGPNADSQSC